MRHLNNFPYNHVLILGLAKSGKAAADLFLRHNISFKVNDLHTDEGDSYVVNLRDQGIEVVLGSHPLTMLDHIDLIVKNPGIPYDHPLIQKAIALNIPIITEIELLHYLLNDEKVIGITGSNGKTTTTTLIYEMLKLYDDEVQLAGNIGYVATEEVQKLREEERLLLELSSFQLVGTTHFKPHISVLLNLYEAHLDYHGSFEQYKQAKAKIFKNQTSNDYIVYNAEDEDVKQLLIDCRAQKIPFSTKRKLKQGAWIDDCFVYFRKEKIIPLTSIALVGEHNLENILAAVAIAKLCNVTNEVIKKVLKTFRGVEHRLQFVGRTKGIAFYNDSKATNILATQKALKSFENQIILLAGGLDRGDSFDELIPYLSKVKALVLFGETKYKLAEVAKKAKIDQVLFATDVREATEKAYKLAVEGDTILLSPACASWDQYKTYEERGNMFVQTVHTLA